jgi:acyl-CoA dehydrogenase
MQNSIYNSEELVLFRDQLRKFIESEVVPHGKAWEEDGMVPREMFKKMGDLGFLGLRYAEKFGGSEMNTLATAVFAEELGRSTFGGFSASVLVHTDMASPHLANAGNEDQKAQYMPDIVAGNIVTAVAVTESDAGSDVAGIRTRAIKDGDDWVINGSKMFITNGVHGDVYFVAAKTDPDSKGSRGISMFIVEKDTPGFSVGRALDKMGWRCSDTAELVFEDCRVPARNMLGEENKGFYAVMKNFQNERTVIGGIAMGEAQKAIDLTLDYVKDRKAFGASLWDKQAIRQRLAMRQAEVDAGRQLLYHAAWLDSQGLECVKDVSAVKVYCAELVNKVMYDCQQFHGGFGYIMDSAIERMVRDARILPVGGGATEVMLEEMAKRM